jgi:hypothetical protein
MADALMTQHLNLLEKIFPVFSIGVDFEHPSIPLGGGEIHVDAREIEAH